MPTYIFDPSQSDYSAMSLCRTKEALHLLCIDWTSEPSKEVIEIQLGPVSYRKENYRSGLPFDHHFEDLRSALAYFKGRDSFAVPSERRGVFIDPIKDGAQYVSLIGAPSHKDGPSTVYRISIDTLIDLVDGSSGA